MTPDDLLTAIRNALECNDLEAAARLCAKLTREAPHNAEGWYLRAQVHSKQGASAAVLDCCERTLAIAPGHYGAHYCRGVELQKLQRLQESVAAYRAALACEPRLISAYNNLAVVWRELERYEEGLACIRQALALAPDKAHLHHTLGLLLLSQKALDDARAAIEQAIRLQPDYAQAWDSLGLVFQNQKCFAEAERCFRQALKGLGDDANLYLALGVAIQEQLRIAEALECYRKAIALRPDMVSAHHNSAFMYLVLGDYGQGFEEYEWRLECLNDPFLIRDGKRWNGERMDGGTLLVQCEQGIGDSLQFARYLPLVKEAASCECVVLETQAELRGILTGLAGVDVLIPRGEPRPAYDAHVPLMSLPRLFGTNMETIPGAVPYLPVPQDAGACALSIIEQEAAALNVGIVWAGNPGHSKDAERSCDLGHFASLLDIEGIRLFSLQVGGRAADLRASAWSAKVVDLGGALDDFADTAAAVKSLDLVISVDTSVVHLAGALGCPVWILLACTPDWRWMLDRGDSPWYPSARLFRQTTRGDWAGVFERLRSELQRMLAGRTGTGGALPAPAPQNNALRRCFALGHPAPSGKRE